MLRAFIYIGCSFKNYFSLDTASISAIIFTASALGGYFLETITPTSIATAKEGKSTSSTTKYYPTLSISLNTKLKCITDTNPEIIEAIAPFSESPFQKSVRIITGQKVAAIPDQPKIMTQNTCLYGDT